jgi:hypothetical protein
MKIKTNACIQQARLIIGTGAVLLGINANAQIWKGAQATGSTGCESISLATDDNRNNYNCGSFSGTSTFGTTSLTSAGGFDAYLTKTDENGNYLWAVSIASGTGDDRTAAVVCDPTGTDIYVTGYFTGTSTFGGTTTLTSAGSYDTYIAKYNSSGGFIWVKQITGTGTEQSEDLAWSRCIGICRGSYVFITGEFSGSTNFGGTTLTSVGSSDIFTASYNSSGTLLWVKQASSSFNAISSKAIAVDRSTNDVYITGGLYGTGTFGTLSLSSSTTWDQFLLKYNSGGTEQWIKQGSGNYYDEGKDVCVDASGNVYAMGSYQSTSLSFGSYSLSSLGADDISVVKYNSSGTEQWAKSIGGTYGEVPGEMAADAVGNIYLTGSFGSTTLTLGTLSLTADAASDAFVARITSSGTFDQAVSPVGTVSYATIYPTGLTVTNIQTVNLCGNFNYGFTFGSTTITASGGQKGYLAKLSAGSWPVYGGSSGIDQLFNMDVDPAGNTYLSGMYGGSMSLGNGVTLPAPTAPVPAPQNAFVVKYNTTGKAEWARYGAPTTYWGGNACGGDAVAYDASGNVYMSGEYINSTTFGSTTLTGSGCYLVKYNASGTQQWAIQISDNGNVKDMTIDASGNIFITGDYYSTTTFYGSPSVVLTGTGGYITKFNSSGSALWAVNACSAGYGNSIALSGTDIFLAGQFSGSGTTFGSATVTANAVGSYDMFVAKYNSSGVGQSVLAAGSTASDVMHNVACIGSDVYVTGEFQGTISFGGLITSGGSYDGLLAKINASSMTITWTRQVAGTGAGECKGLAVNGTTVYVSGEFSGAAVFGDGIVPPVNKTSTGSSDVYIEKFDASGAYQWISTLGGLNTDHNIGAGIDANSHAYVAGDFLVSITIDGTAHSSAGNEDFYAEKFVSNTGAFVRLAGPDNDEENSDLAQDLSDDIKVYPNPSNGNVTISFESEAQKEVMLYDITGRLITKSTVSVSEMKLDFSDQPAGMYFLRIVTGGKQVLTKLIRH